MAVIDENENVVPSKYEYLKYVEFIDMICRMALVGINI